MYPIKPGYAPSSDESILSIFRNEIKNQSRGEIEAWGKEFFQEKILSIFRNEDLSLRVEYEK